MAWASNTYHRYAPGERQYRPALCRPEVTASSCTLANFVVVGLGKGGLPTSQYTSSNTWPLVHNLSRKRAARPWLDANWQSITLANHSPAFPCSDNTPFAPMHSLVAGDGTPYAREMQDCHPGYTSAMLRLAASAGSAGKGLRWLLVPPHLSEASR